MLCPCKCHSGLTPIKLYLSKYSHYSILGLNRFPLLVVTGGHQLSPLQYVVYVGLVYGLFWLLFFIKRETNNS